MPYPDKFYPVVDTVAWVTRLARLGVGTIQLRAKDLNESEALQIVTDALEALKGTDAKRCQPRNPCDAVHHGIEAVRIQHARTVSQRQE